MHGTHTPLFLASLWKWDDASTGGVAIVVPVERVELGQKRQRRGSSQGLGGHGEVPWRNWCGDRSHRKLQEAPAGRQSWGRPLGRRAGRWRCGACTRPLLWAGRGLTLKPRASVGCSLARTTLAELTGSLGSCKEKWSQALTSRSSGPYLAGEQADPTSGWQLTPTSTPTVDSSAWQAAQPLGSPAAGPLHWLAQLGGGVHMAHRAPSHPAPGQTGSGCHTSHSREESTEGKEKGTWPGDSRRSRSAVGHSAAREGPAVSKHTQLRRTNSTSVYSKGVGLPRPQLRGVGWSGGWIRGAQRVRRPGRGWGALSSRGRPSKAPGGQGFMC